MCRMYDISTHIFLLKQFKLNNNLLTEMLSKDNGISYSKSINKINLNDENTIEKINIDLIENKSIILKWHYEIWELNEFCKIENK